MAWYDANYGYKKKITIDHTKVGGDETDIPVLISVTDNDLRDEANGGHVKSANGYDILFTNSAEDTQLKHEIEKYVNTSGLLVFWVKVSSLSSTVDTDIYIYYGKAGVVADPSSTDTWDNDFLAVWHMNSLLDSTSNNIDLTNVGAESGAVGKMGDCYHFTASQVDYMYHATFLDTMPVSGDLTLECWVYHDSFATIYETYVNKLNVAGQDRFYLRRSNAQKLILHAEEGNNGVKTAVDAVNTPDTTWVYQVGRIDAGNALVIIRDGTNKTSGDVLGAGIGNGTAADFQIGTNDVAHVHPMDGRIDEVRISDVVRSDNWIGTTHQSENNPAGFMSWGAEESQTTDASAGIKIWDGTADIELIKDDTSPVKIRTSSATIGVKITDTGSANASAIRVRISATVTKAFKKKT